MARFPEASGSVGTIPSQWGSIAMRTNVGGFVDGHAGYIRDLLEWHGRNSWFSVLLRAALYGYDYGWTGVSTLLSKISPRESIQFRRDDRYVAQHFQLTACMSPDAAKAICIAKAPRRVCGECVLPANAT